MANLEDLFRACDTRGNGYLEQDELRELCSRSGIARQEADSLFEDLDCDADGKISFEDFAKGFSNFLALSTSYPRAKESFLEGYEAGINKSTSLGNQNRRNTQKTLSKSSNRLSISSNTPDELKPPSSKATITMSNSNVTTFERLGLDQFSQGALEDMIEEMSKLREENQRLERNWKREKVEHERHLQDLEQELEGQVKEVEHRAKQKAKEEADEQKKTHKIKMEAEMDQLQANMILFEKMDSLLKSNKSIQQDEKVTEIKHRLDESSHENRQLRMSLMDTQTNVALMRSELSQLRSQYEEKCRELNGEREKVMEVLHEQDHLGKQLHILHDANKRLQDTNDTLRIVLESSASLIPQKKPTTWISRAKRGSIVGDYLNLDPVAGKTHRSTVELYSDQINDSWEEGSVVSKPRSEDLEMMSYRMQRFVKDLAVTNCAHSDSGLSTMKDAEEVEEEDEKHASPKQGRATFQTQFEGNPSPPIIEISPVNSSPFKRSPSSTGSSRSFRMMFFNRDNPSINILGDDTADSTDDFEDGFEPTGPPESTYKVVFIGDAAVGKSSFILRISKGTFVPQLSSTLGVDFQMRTIRVSKRNVALQLWDTAGQERFRSITKSYFRKADGIMLLYDCTSEKSFLNVTHWLQAVEEGASTVLPVMIVANKVDMRIMASASGEAVVSTQTGEKLARDSGAIFIESSAKEGTNIMEAVAKLTKLMLANEDREIRASGMHLKGEKKSGKCCGS